VQTAQTIHTRFNDVVLLYPLHSWICWVGSCSRSEVVCREESIPESKCERLHKFRRHGYRLKFFFDQISETINLSFNPEVLLEVTFPEPSGEPITLHAGVQLTINGKSSPCNFKFHNHNAHGLPSETAGPPDFSIVGHTRCPGPFVIVLVDPDALTPQNPAISQLRHFLGGDFFCANPNSKHWAPLTNTTPAVTEFLRPKPFVGYDAHRYEQLSQLLPKVILIPK